MVGQRSYDCVVLGAGPAGCCAAALVAEHGHSTLLVEREKLPRFHVGESLMPEAFAVLDRLGLTGEMDRLGFTRKSGLQFVDGRGEEESPLLFVDGDELSTAQSWHVERARFDQLLYDTAYNRGAAVFDETTVLDVEIRKSSPHKIQIKMSNGREQEVMAKVVVDATGLQSMIAQKLDLRESDSERSNAAIWTYFNNAKRNGGANPEVTCFLNTRNGEAWFWYVPLSDGTVSIGLVGDSSYVLKRGGSPESRFREEMKQCPGLAGRMMDAQAAGRFYVAKDFSYTVNRLAGDGWVIVGDAAGSNDPIFGSGVFLALQSASMAADAVVSGLASGNLSERVLGSWTAAYERGVAPIRRLIGAFYSKPFSLGEFLKVCPHQQANLMRVLSGRTFESGSSAVFDELDPWLDGTGHPATAT